MPAAQGTHLGSPPRACLSGSGAERGRGCPHGSPRTAGEQAQTRRHTENIWTALAASTAAKTPDSCRPRDLHPGAEPAGGIAADRRPPNATKPRNFLRARADILGARATAAGRRTSPRRRKRSPLKPTSPADAIACPAVGNPSGFPGPVWSVGQDVSRDVTAVTSARSCGVTQSGPAHPGREPSLENNPKVTINHQG